MKKTVSTFFTNMKIYGCVSSLVKEYGTRLCQHACLNLIQCVYLSLSGNIGKLFAPVLYLCARVHIDGLCQNTLFDTEYALITIPPDSGSYDKTEILYMGKFSSTIILDRRNGRWVLTSKAGDAQAVIIATPESLALGTHTLMFENDECTSKLSNKEVVITLTHCVKN